MRITRSLVHAAQGWVVVASLSGCLAASSREKLLEAVHGYNDAVRWGQPGAASVYVPVEARAEFATGHGHEDLQIADYELVHVDLAQDRTFARVRVNVTWLLRSDGLIRQTAFEQRWEQKSGRWALVGERRVGGEPMPWAPGRRVSRR